MYSSAFCLPINNYETKITVRILLLMSLDSILVSSVVSVSGPYTELHERVYLHCLVLVHKYIVYQQILEICCAVLTLL